MINTAGNSAARLLKECHSVHKISEVSEGSNTPENPWDFSLAWTRPSKNKQSVIPLHFNFMYITYGFDIVHIHYIL